MIFSLTVFEQAGREADHLNARGWQQNVANSLLLHHMMVGSLDLSYQPLHNLENDCTFEI